MNKWVSSIDFVLENCFWSFGASYNFALFLKKYINSSPFSCIIYSKRDELMSFLMLLGTAAAAAAKSLQSCPTLCNPIDHSPPGSSVPGILQARTMEWVAISFPNAWKSGHSVVSDSSRSYRLQPTSSSAHGIFQARVLEWGAIAFSSLFPSFFK